MDIVKKTAVAPPPSSNTLEFVMSDASVDRMGDVIEQDGWELENFNKNPIALFGHDSHFPIGTWKDVRVDKKRLIGRLELMSAVSDRLQEIHTAVNAGVLRAVSVGFRPIEAERLDDKSGGVRFMKNELVECSLVAVPANPNAILTARQLNLSPETQDLIFGKTADKGQQTGPNPSGKSADSHLSYGSKQMSLSEKIEQSQTRLNGFRDQLTNHLAGVSEEMDEQAQTMAEELNLRISNEQRQLDIFKSSEAALGSRSDPLVSTTSVSTASGNRRPFAAPKKDVKPSDYVYRAATAALIAHVSRRPLQEVVRERYGDDEVTHRVSEAIIYRGATVPATTTLAGWAAELVQTSVLDFIDSLMPLSVYPGLSSRGGRFTFGRNGIVSLPSRLSTPTLAGAFVAEGAPIPVRQGAFTSITLTPKKMGVISTFTRQIAEHSTPAIEAQIRSMMADDTAIALDTVLLDANPATATRPAGLRNGVAGLTATSGGGFNALVGDIKQLMTVLVTANSLRSPTFIMNPVDVMSIALTQNAGGDFPFAADAANGTLQGYPILTSTTQTAKSIILVDAADFFSATGDDPRFDVSDQAVLHMEDTAPQQIGVSGSATNPIRSMFQTDSIALRMMLDVNWAMRRTGVVAWVSGVTW